MKDKSSVQQIKKEKRDRRTEPPDGMTRRNFLTYLGVGSAALAAVSGGVLPRSAGAQQGEGFAGAASTPYLDSSSEPPELSFEPIEPSAEDKLVLPEGFKFDIIRKWGEPITSDGREFGYNNDYVAYFPIDALDGGTNSEDGILWVNHEYVDSKWVSEFDDSDDGAERTPEQVAKEKEAVGGSVIRVRKDSDAWTFVEDDEYNRRIDANTPMGVTGPGGGSAEMQMEGTDEVIGTLANCSGGVTPWNTVLSCEENFQYYYGEKTVEDASQDDEINADATWLSDPDNAQPPEHYGWVVEVDPFDRESRPRKHTWLGRFAHENVAIRVSESGKVVTYTGHDATDECVYKFVSSGTYDPENREANMDLLSDGMLYVADFANGRWVALDYENNPIFRDNDFKSQADVLVRAPEAAKLSEEEDGDPIGTPMDRCEDIEVHPETGTIYAALTNNADHGNFHGQILRMYEKDGDAEATEFTFEIFAAGGPNTGFSSPDNLAFDRKGNLWMVTDISSSKLNSGIYETFKNNGMFVMAGAEDAVRGEPTQFASGPVDCELTGPAFSPDGRTLFLAIQHPGEESESTDDPTSTWPHDGDNIPKPSVVAITGFA